MSETIAAPQTALIPLEIVPDPGLVPNPGTQHLFGFKVGIPVSLDNGNTYKLYEFDTGGGGFQAAYNQDWWGSNIPVNGGTVFSTTYKSGIVDNSEMVSVPVTFQTMPGSATIPAANYDVAKIVSVSDTDTASDFSATWTTDVAGGTMAPLYGNFWGDFGASLENTNPTLLPGGSGFLSVLPQLPGSLANGFIVALGPEPAQGQTGEGYLQVGLTTADINSFPIKIEMGGTTGTYSNSGLPTYSGILSTGTLALTDNLSINNPNTYTTVAGLVWDTGTPTVEIYPGATLSADGLQAFLKDPNSTVGGALASGNLFDLTSTADAASLKQVLNFIIGTISGDNAVNEGDPQNTLGDGSMNTGLQPFFRWDVMFDVADGIIGLRPHQAAPCFAAGTSIATERGCVRVEELHVGDRVRTLLGDPTGPVEWVGHRRVDCRRHPHPRQVWPVRIVAGAFGPTQPERDLLLSPDHAVYAQGVLIPVKCLVNGSTITQLDVDAVTYYHVKLPCHDIVLAEGLPVESYLDTGDRSSFANGGGAVTLHPDFSALSWEAKGCAPLMIVGSEVQTVRQLLDLRAADRQFDPARAAPQPQTPLLSVECDDLRVDELAPCYRDIILP